ncbi:hypothetical protein R1flu_026857 [Riccia fluitans]|uniref:RHD domain-containing protein n=1 Tax=Riccia fluitans TaxID=41844 RepID=A0ABD1XH59_9MARC
MGQTVSLGACLSGGSVVRVMNTRGNFESYDFPVVTAEVMLNHPDHLVVHCPQILSGQKEQQFHIMLPDDPLLPGQPYLLYRIPEKHKGNLARSKSFSIVKRQMEAENGGEEVSAVPEKKKGRRHTLKLLFTRLQLVTYLASKLEHKATDEHKDENKLLLEGGQGAQEQKRNPPPQPLEMPLFHWRPNLSSIPESPLGFHSIPTTPQGLYKMDSITEVQFNPGQTAAVH